MEIKIQNTLENPDLNIPFYLSALYLSIASNLKQYYILGFLKKKLILVCVGQQDTSDFISLRTAPFGGIFFQEEVTDSEIELFLSQSAEKLKTVGFTRWIIRQPANCYKKFLPDHSLKKNGFEIAVENYSYLIPLQKPISLHNMEQRKLKKLEINDWNVVHLETKDLKNFYQALTTSREYNNTPLSISFETLQNLLCTIPSKYQLFAVRRKEEWAAGVVMVYPSPGIAYYFLPFTLPEFKKNSPMVLLLWHLINLYKDKKFSYLDLGITSIEGQLQDSLAIFKEHMGAFKTSVTSLIKNL